MPTTIEWVTNPDGTKGETWNPVTGCTKVSAGCANCYAERMARRLAGRYGYPEAPRHFDVTLRPDRLEQPLRWQKPRTVFVCSMGDLFHEDVPFEFIERVFNIMSQAKHHVFQVLTKRPQRMLQWQRWEDDRQFGLDWIQTFPNVWLLVSIENQAAADERIPLLLQTPAAVRGVSVEPMLGPIDFANIRVSSMEVMNALAGIAATPHSEPPRYHKLDWVIAGGESGPGARPMHPDWARSLVQQCQAAHVPVFVKQMGAYWAKYAEPGGDWHSTVKQRGDVKGHKMQYWPEDLRIREMPAAGAR